jgi:hypothetical protein
VTFIAESPVGIVKVVRLGKLLREVDGVQKVLGDAHEGEKYGGNRDLDG